MIPKRKRADSKNVGGAARAGLLAGAVGVGLAAATTAAAWHWLARRPLPKQEGKIELDELEGSVRIRRDRWGVPHIEAESAADLWFAEGFCHGQDRLFQMDFYRRVVSGRLSEMAGAETLPVDRLMRTLGIRRAAEREEANLDTETRALLERFCAGVNAAAASAKAMPFEMQLLRQSFAPWRPVDILSIGKLLAFGLSTNWERELLRSDMTRALGPELAAKLDPGYPADNPVVTQEAWSGDGLALAEQIDAVRNAIGMATEASGSNNWAVSGALSATGSPLLAGDPHLPQSMPGINLHAMGLVYATLLSLIPLLAFAFVVLKNFGGHLELQPIILEFFKPVGDKAGEFTQKVMEVADGISTGLLGPLAFARCSGPCWHYQEGGGQLQFPVARRRTAQLRAARHRVRHAAHRRSDRRGPAF